LLELGLLNRRHLRVKAFHGLYSFFQTEKKEVYRAQKELEASCEKTLELYTYYLSFLVEARHIAELRIEEGYLKNLPSKEDLNPNTKFLHNTVLTELCENSKLKALCDLYKINWELDEPGIVRRTLRKLIDSDEYTSYLDSSVRDPKEDYKILEYYFTEFIANDEDVQAYLEEKNVYWQDDLDLVCSQVLKTLKNFSRPDKPSVLLSLFKKMDDGDTEDKDFVNQLFSQALAKTDANLELIGSFSANWDLERIAITDRIIMSMAITEAIHFKQIPLRVTLNEYIEIAKNYSTPKSSPFINGILDKLFTQLEKDKTIVKIGRGIV